MDLKAFDESIRSNNFYCDFRSFTIENFPIIFNNRIYVSIKSNRSISFNFSIILIFLKRLLINRKYNLIILEEFFFFLSLVSTVSKISYLFFSLGWKESTFRLSLPCRPRWCNGSAFALDHFSFFFFSLPSSSSSSSYLVARIYDTLSRSSLSLFHLFSPLSGVAYSLFFLLLDRK